MDNSLDRLDIVQELLDHRDRVVDGWVKGPPDGPGTACLFFWEPCSTTDAKEELVCVSPQAQDFISHSLEDSGVVGTVYSIGFGILWNDKQATKQEVIDVLDRAIRLAKEDGNG